MSDESTLYADRDEKYSRIIHCEMNALLFSSELIRGYTLYTWPFASCDRCVVHMLQAGVQRFVFPALPEDKKERWEKPLRKTLEYLQESGVNWREI
jgi:dCMP deaminase